jgi:hypothetical protein
VGRGEKHCGHQKVFDHHTNVTIEKLPIATWLWWPKTFQLLNNYGNWKPFGSHMQMAIEKNSFTIVMCLLNSIVIQCHWINLIAIRQWLCISIITDGSVGIFGRHLGTIKWHPNLS